MNGEGEIFAYCPKLPECNFPVWIEHILEDPVDAQVSTFVAQPTRNITNAFRGASMALFVRSALAFIRGTVTHGPDAQLKMRAANTRSGDWSFGVYSAEGDDTRKWATYALLTAPKKSTDPWWLCDEQAYHMGDARTELFCATWRVTLGEGKGAGASFLRSAAQNFCSDGSGVARISGFFRDVHACETRYYWVADDKLRELHVPCAGTGECESDHVVTIQVAAKEAFAGPVEAFVNSILAAASWRSAVRQNKVPPILITDCGAVVANFVANRHTVQNAIRIFGLDGASEEESAPAGYPAAPDGTRWARVWTLVSDAPMEPEVKRARLGQE